MTTLKLREHLVECTLCQGWSCIILGQVSKVASSCFYQLGNSVLAGLPRCTTEPLQCVLNAAARLVLNVRLHDHLTPALQQLHWLPIEYRITYKLSHNSPCAYQPCATVPIRLRSDSFQQSTWSEILRHIRLRQAEV